MTELPVKFCEEFEDDSGVLEELLELLELDPHTTFISIESMLSDFSSCGLPWEPPMHCTLMELYALWDQWITEELKKRYNVDLTSTRIYMRDLCQKIAENRPSVLH